MTMTKVNNKIYELADVEQGSIAWKMLRLGKITSSNLGLIISAGRKQTELFSETGKGYLYEVASELNLRDEYKDEKGAELYFERTDFKSKEMEYGSKMEEKARELYSLLMSKKGLFVGEVGFVECLDEYSGYGDSPDGLIYDDKDKTNAVGALEIKCPKGSTFIKYKSMFDSGYTLKEIEPKYYWQCLGHILANNVKWCDFVFFDVMQKNGFVVKRISPYDNEQGLFDMELLKERIQTGIMFVRKTLNNEI